MTEKGTWTESKAAQAPSKFENHHVNERMATDLLNSSQFFAKNAHQSFSQFDSGNSKIPVADIAKDGSISFPAQHAKPNDGPLNNDIAGRVSGDDSRNRSVPKDSLPLNEKDAPTLIPDYMKELKKYLL